MFITSLLLMTSINAFSPEDMKCEARRAGRDVMPVEITFFKNNILEKEIVTDYNRHRISVRYYVGNQFEPVSVLEMKMDTHYAKIQKPENGLGYEIGNIDDVNVQCYYVED